MAGRLFGWLLPRHLEIIYEINAASWTRSAPGSPATTPAGPLSIIDESGERYVRMAHLATSAATTSTAWRQLHSELLKQTVMRDFAELWPEKFCNVTNGVTPRRFVAVSNPPLAQLITSRIGDGWLRDLDQLRRLEPLADDPEFQRQWREVKLGRQAGSPR
jgi:glycogen phosphorylase